MKKNIALMQMISLQELSYAMRSFSILLFAASLYACSGTTVKEDKQPQTTVARQGVAHVDVNTDVKRDFNSAIKLLQQGDNEQAIAVLSSVIEREQRLPAPYVNIAIAYNRIGDRDAAEKNLISALKLDISHPVANNELGLIYRKAGKFNAARTAYQNAIAKHPEYLPARKNLGVLCDLYTHDYQCALEQFEGYLELKPDDETVTIWVADLKQRLGQ